MPQKEVVRFGYHTIGLRAWEQPGTDMSRRVNYLYNALQLVDSVDYPVVNGQNAAEVFRYDQWGNLQKTRTPLGHWTEYQSDALGRAWKTVSPIDAVRSQVQELTFYPNTDLLESSRTMGQNGTITDTVLVANTYDAERALLSVSRRSGPDINGIGWITTRWDYDRAGRKIAEWAPDGTPDRLDNPVDSTFYDAAGNAVRMRTRRFAAIGAYVTIDYDALNRMIKRRVPSVFYAERQDGFSQRYYDRAYAEERKMYPRYPNDGTGYRIPNDSAVFVYDMMGNMRIADNGDALVRRSYFPNGLLATDSSYVREAEGPRFDRHAYGLRLFYDLNGRRKELHHPQQLAPSATQTQQSYAYHSETGALESVTDLAGNFFRYSYNGRGELSGAQLPGSYEEYRYDAEGNLVDHRVNGSALALRLASISYNARGQIDSIRNHHGTRDTLRTTHSGLGHITSSTGVSRAQNAIMFGCVTDAIRMQVGETIRHDALGNLNQTSSSQEVSSRCGEDWSNGISQLFRYEVGTGRLASTEPVSSVVQRDSIYYDRGGNVEFTANPRAIWVQNGTLRERASYYGADEKLRAADARYVKISNENDGHYEMTFEEYRYDALGRRVWVRSRQYCEYLPNETYATCNIDKVRRTVWDGDQELWEIQMPGQDGSAHIENDAAALPDLRWEPGGCWRRRRTDRRTTPK